MVLKKKNYPGQLLQWSTLLKRAYTVVKRDPTVTLVRLLQTCFNAFIILSVYFQISDNKSSVEGSYNRQGVCLLLTMFNFNASMFAVLVNISSEKEVLFKEYYGRFYGILPYFCTKFIVELPLAIFFPTLLVSIIYYGVNLNNDFSKFAECIACCSLLGLAGQSAGVMVGSMCNDFRVATLVAAGIFFPSIIFSGCAISFDSMSPSISWIQYISIFRYGLEW